MNLLAKLEHSMERLFEGTISSVFRQSLQPAELGKRLRRAMLDQKRPSIGTSIVPNRYVVHLHPKDFAQFQPFQGGLCRQMETYLAEVAEGGRFSLLDRIKVELVEDASVGRRSPRIEATITDIAARRPVPPAHSSSRQFQPPPAQATQAFRPGNSSHAFDSPARDELLLRVVSGSAKGQEIRLRDGSSTIGRSGDNTLVINAADVSRRHARIDSSGGTARIHDLNSTNGTRVNGESVRISDILPGDVITLGSHEIRVVPIPSDDFR